MGFIIFIAVILAVILVRKIYNKYNPKPESESKPKTKLEKFNVGKLTVQVSLNDSQGTKSTFTITGYVKVKWHESYDAYSVYSSQDYQYGEITSAQYIFMKWIDRKGKFISIDQDDNLWVSKEDIKEILIIKIEDHLIEKELIIL